MNRRAVIIAVLCLLLGASIAGIYLWSIDRGERNNSDNEETRTLTYTNERYGFAFEYPSSFEIYDLTLPEPLRPTSNKPVLNIGVDKIDEVEFYIERCRAVATQLYEKQREELLAASVGSSFNDGFIYSKPGVLYSNVISNGGAKIAYGISVCQPEGTEDNTSPYLQFVALTFRDDLRIGLGIAVEATGMSKQFINALPEMLGNREGDGLLQRQYNDFEAAVATLRFTN
jgi:hypothetical protein